MVEEGSATTCMIQAVGADGKNREMVGIHKDDFRIFLLGIDTSRMRNREVAEKIVVYKREVKQVLKDYYETGVAVRSIDNLTRKEILQMALDAEEALEAEKVAHDGTRKALQVAEPKANVHDKVLDKDSSLNFMKVLSTLQDDFPTLKRDDLKELMRREVLIQKNTVDSTAKARTAGYAKDVAVGDFNGRTRTQSRWTSKGINYLILRIEDGELEVQTPAELF